MKVPCQGKGLTHCVRDLLLWDSRALSMLPSGGIIRLDLIKRTFET